MSTVKSNQFINSVSFRVLKSQTLSLPDTEKLVSKYLSSLTAEDATTRSGHDDTVGRLEILLEHLAQQPVKEAVVDFTATAPTHDKDSAEKEKKREEKKKRKHESEQKDAPSGERDKKKHKKSRHDDHE